MRHVERRLVFDVPALLQAIAKSVNKPYDSILKFSKIAEGGSYRVFEAVFRDGLPVIARLPYPCTVPRSFGVASEVATMEFLRVQGIPVPQIFDWSSSTTNSVGSEYIITTRVEGQELEHTWYTMDLKERMSMVEKIVDLESKLFQIQLPANGSLYHTSFLESQGMTKIPFRSADTNVDKFCIGLSTEYLWWYRGREELAVNRGLCMPT